MLHQGSHAAETCQVNVSDSASVAQLAQKAAQMGCIDAIVQTTGVSHIMGSTKLVCDVNLVSTVNVITEFLTVELCSMSMVCIMSLTAQLSNVGSLSSKLQTHLAIPTNCFITQSSISKFLPKSHMV